MSKWSVKCVAAAAAAGLMLGSMLPASAEEAMVRQYETPAAQVHSVLISAEQTDVVIQKGEGDTIRVESSADPEGEYAYHCNVENGVLNIDIEGVKIGGYTRIDLGALKIFSVSYWDNQVTVTLPEKVYDQITVRAEDKELTLNGVTANQVEAEAREDISIQDVQAGERLWAETTSGDLYLVKARGQEIVARTQNGDLYLEEPYALQYNCRTRNGDIVGTIAGAEADYTVTIDSESEFSERPGSGVGEARFVTYNGTVQVSFTG